MALANFTDLKTAIQDFANDSTVSTRLDDFVTLAESEMKADPNFRFSSMLIYGTLSMSPPSQNVSLPTDFVQAIRLHVNGNPQKIVEIVSPHELNRHYTSTVGKPSYAVITSTAMEFNRIPDSAYSLELLYYRLTSLATSPGTNEAFPKYSSLYLYGSLKHAMAFLQQEEKMVFYQALYDKALATARRADQQRRYGMPTIQRGMGGP